MWRMNYNNLADLYLAQNRLDEAEQYAHRAREIKETLDLSVGTVDDVQHPRPNCGEARADGRGSAVAEEGAGDVSGVCGSVGWAG